MNIECYKKLTLETPSKNAKATGRLNYIKNQMFMWSVNHTVPRDLAFTIETITYKNESIHKHLEIEKKKTRLLAQNIFS